MIDEWIVSGEHPGLSVNSGTGRVRLTVNQARDAVRGVGGDTGLRDAVWREAILEAQRDAPGDEMGRLFAVWLAEPWMRRALSLISTRLRVSHEDLEAEMVTSFLEGLTAANVELPGVGKRLLKSAANRTWSAARSGAREIATEDPSVFAQLDDLDLFPRDGWELEIAPPAREDGLSAAIRFAASPAQVEGERLGTLAHRLGLMDIVYRARRPAEGRPIGTLSLRPVGAAR
ncbi:hypothetical protein [Streptosporangium lutulentum]|uniref:Uncharacterized protein n=1 Tax=Streptosporangium lutulentum TaxID=1461250 RepID=A0ABT9QBG0_9ACTN|nr:hypothetical protein [Streptosporangium lutulentum]MDP9844049.1 hypothetical protein [Streptosporangium lutulentum]